MEDQQTCGKGLAAHAALPRKVGKMTAAVADVLALHRETLDLDDENSRLEDAAYAKLVKAHRRIASELDEMAGQMAGYRDLPMGRHDEGALSDPRHAEAFSKFVALEQQLLDLLRERLEADRRMLAVMERGSEG